LKSLAKSSLKNWFKKIVTLFKNIPHSFVATLQNFAPKKEEAAACYC
jgi:hypothetical protein